MCFNDHCAIGALMALVRAGKRVPQDIFGDGYDGIDLAGVSALELSTIDQKCHTNVTGGLEAKHTRARCSDAVNR